MFSNYQSSAQHGPSAANLCRSRLIHAVACFAGVSLAAASLALAQSPETAPQDPPPIEMFVGLRQVNRAAPQPAEAAAPTAPEAIPAAAEKLAPAPVPPDQAQADRAVQPPPPTEPAAADRAAGPASAPSADPAAGPASGTRPEVHSGVVQTAEWTAGDNSPAAIPEKAHPESAGTPAGMVVPPGRLTVAYEPIPETVPPAPPRKEAGEPAAAPPASAAPAKSSWTEQPDHANAFWYSPAPLFFALLLLGPLVTIGVVSLFSLWLLTRVGKAGGNTEPSVEAHRLIYTLLKERETQPAAREQRSVAGPRRSLRKADDDLSVARSDPPPAPKTTAPAPDGDLLKKILADNLKLRQDDAGGMRQPWPD
jgi:hypothetical protein